MATAQTVVMTKTFICIIGGIISTIGAGGLLYYHPSAWPWLLMITAGLGLAGWTQVTRS